MKKSQLILLISLIALVLSLIIFFSVYFYVKYNNINIVNVPFAVIEKNDFTLEEVADAIRQPLILGTDENDTLTTAYSKIRKTKSPSKLNIDNETEIALMVFRGHNGSCENAEISIKQISRLKNNLKVYVKIDRGDTGDQQCRITVNPYEIVKIQKEIIQYNKSLNLELINNDTKEVLSSKSINQFPSLLK